LSAILTAAPQCKSSTTCHLINTFLASENATEGTQSDSLNFELNMQFEDIGLNLNGLKKSEKDKEVPDLSFFPTIKSGTSKIPTANMRKLPRKHALRSMTKLNLLK
jgi:hypothetical protein